MGFRNKIIRISVIIAMVLVYATVLWSGLTEEGRRSLRITRSPSSSADFVMITVRVTSIDTVQGLLHERIRLVPKGRFAMDKNTPAVDLTLLLNSMSGKQSVVFPKGERIVPINSTTLLSGNPNRYPFDRYTSNIDLLVTVPAQQSAVSMPEENPEDDADSNSSLIVGTSDLNHSETIPIQEDFTASISGVKFSGALNQDDTYKLMRTTIAMRRANNVILLSLIVMTVMLVLAASIVGMVLHVTVTPGEINLLPLSLCVALIFGLPALRNVQPSVPPVGALSDYISFIWAELMVSISAIALAWIWIDRSRGDERTVDSSVSELDNHDLT
jgi:Domain of unknown function (DUF4436)